MARGAGMTRIVALCLRHTRMTLLVALVLALGAAWVVTQRFAMSTDTADLIWRRSTGASTSARWKPRFRNCAM